VTDIGVVVRKKREGLARRKKHVAKLLFGTPERPRLVVFRSNRHVYAQLIDDKSRLTLTGCSTLTPSVAADIKAMKGKIDEAKRVGKEIAALAKTKGIEVVAFDRNGRRYHGRIKAVADGAREGGLKF